MASRLQRAKVNAKTYQLIEDGVAEGATTVREIAAACGIAHGTFENYIYRAKNKANRERRDKIYAAIEAGMGRLRDRLSRAAENSLLKLVEGYEYHETSKEVTERLVGGKKQKTTVTKTSKKHKAPNSTAVIFALCNAEGVKRDGRWQSITGTNTDVDISVNMPDGVTIEYDGNLSYD